jgi:hypothetical protein
MRTTLLMVLAVTMLAAEGPVQASQIFDFSFTNDGGNVSGTVTGRILGLNDNSTGPASHVLIDSFPGALSGLGAAPIDTALWNFPIVNSFTVTGGIVTAADFLVENDSPSSVDALGINEHDDFNVNRLLSVDKSTFAEPEIISRGGLSAAHVTLAPSSTPEPATITLLGTAVVAIGALRLRRRQTLRQS